MPDSAAEVVQLVTVGFFKRWQVSNVVREQANGEGDETVVVPPSAASADNFTEALRDETRRREVYVRGCKSLAVAFPLQLKVLKVEASDNCTFEVRGGSVASVELLRCKKLTLRISAPVAAVRIDDCNDVTIELSWAARMGYVDESIEQHNMNSQNASHSSSGGGASGGVSPSAGMGFNVFSTGSHAVRVNYPVSPDTDSRRVERLIPETLHTRFTGDQHEPATTVVDARQPWGNAPRARPAAAASVPSHALGVSVAPTASPESSPVPLGAAVLATEAEEATSEVALPVTVPDAATEPTA